MTHLSGHVGSGNKSFGILYPIKLIDPSHPKKGFAENHIDLPLLYIGFGQHFKPKDKVGFQPYLIPWGNGKYLVIAADVVKFTIHEKAERLLLNSKKIKLEDSGKDKLEDWSTGVDIARLERVVNNEPKVTKYRDLLLASLRYMRSDSFNRLYNGRNNNEIIDWIVKYGVPLEDTGVTCLHNQEIGSILGNKFRGKK